MAYCAHCGASILSTPCPFCGAATLSDQVTILPAVPVGRTPAPPPERNLAKWVVLGIVGVCIVGGAAAFLLGRDGSDPQVSPQPSLSLPTAPTAPAAPPVTSKPISSGPKMATITPSSQPTTDPIADARAKLASTYTVDRSKFAPQDQWVIQLDSKWHGIVDPNQIAGDGSHTFQVTDIWSSYQRLRAAYGDRVLLIQSTDLGKQVAFPTKPSSEVLWTVVFDPGSLKSQEAANAWCRGAFPGVSGDALANLCYPRRATVPHS